MANFPHTYNTVASATHDSLLTVSSKDKPDITTSAPVQFGGPQGNWTPEDFFCASISSCFILTFKNYTKGKKLDWRNIKVDVDAILDVQDRKLSFTKVIIKVNLEICCESNVDPYLKALEKSEKMCLITNSINSEIELKPFIKVKAK